MLPSLKSEVVHCFLYGNFETALGEQERFKCTPGSVFTSYCKFTEVECGGNWGGRDAPTFLEYSSSIGDELLLCPLNILSCNDAASLQSKSKKSSSRIFDTIIDIHPVSLSSCTQALLNNIVLALSQMIFFWVWKIPFVLYVTLFCVVALIKSNSKSW